MPQIEAQFQKALAKYRRTENAVHVREMVLRTNDHAIFTPVQDNGTSGIILSDPEDTRYLSVLWGAGPGGGHLGLHWHDQTETIVVLEGFIKDLVNDMVFEVNQSLFIPPTEIHGYEFGPNSRIIVSWLPSPVLRIVSDNPGEPKP